MLLPGDVMRHAAVVVCAGLAGSLVVSALGAQRARFGAAVGPTFGDNAIIVPDGRDSVTGARRTGLHLRAFVDVPLTADVFSFRGELFYNRLTSGPNTYAFVGSGSAKSALTDRTMGLTGSFVATPSPGGGLAPYFTLGAGMFMSRLGYNPEPNSTAVTRTKGAFALGVLVGAGLRIRAARPTLVLDWRYYQALHNTRGSAFMPLSLGVVF